MLKLLSIKSRLCGGLAVVIFSWLLSFTGLGAQTPRHYEASLESLDQHPLPRWYAEAKLGIFIHWGLYSVPGWAPLVHPEHDFTSQEYITHNPGSAWHLGAPKRVDSTPLLGFPTYDTASTFTAGLMARF